MNPLPALITLHICYVEFFPTVKNRNKNTPRFLYKRKRSHRGKKIIFISLDPVSESIKMLLRDLFFFYLNYVFVKQED